MVAKTLEWIKMPKRAELVFGVVLYLVSLAFQYGIFYARINAVEVTIQEIKEDVHEIRNHVWETPRR